MIAERFHFHKRNQAVGETSTEFDAALRRLATHCKFGDALEEALRNRFVCGLRHEAIQRRLLSESDLTYAKGMELAQGMEAADKHSKAFTADKHSKAFKTSEPSIRKFSSQHTTSSRATEVADEITRQTSAGLNLLTVTSVVRTSL